MPAQLKDRLGADAAARLKLMPRPHDESSNPPLDKAQELAAASHQPAPLLADYIAAAAKRDPIPCEPGNARRVDPVGAPSTASASSMIGSQSPNGAQRSSQAPRPHQRLAHL